MHIKSRTLFLLVLLSISGVANAQQKLWKENIFNKERGFFSCSGMSSAPLFKQECLELSLDRISFGGDIIYEGTCLDSSGKKFRLSCSNFTFEPEVLESGTKKNYFDK
jgi:hypothetical protein